LANAKQAEVNADNLLALAKSSFNNLLRRDINAPLNIVDILLTNLQTTPWRQHRRGVAAAAEIKAAELTVEQAKEAVTIARSGYFPTISLAGNYAKTADQINLDGHWNERYTVQALAVLAFSDWWRLGYKVGESKVRVTQAQEVKYQVVDNIILEVKQSFINMEQSEKNIFVAQKSIEQAEENLRLEEERYKYQVSTQTDVLNAVTFLAQQGSIITAP